MNAKSPTLPPFPAKTGPGRKRSGPVPAWGLKLGGLLTTIAVFAGSFGFASAHPYVGDAPLQPATVAAVATPTPSTATNSTTTLTSTVRTTTRTAVTTTKSS